MAQNYVYFPRKVSLRRRLHAVNCSRRNPKLREIRNVHVDVRANKTQEIAFANKSKHNEDVAVHAMNFFLHFLPLPVSDVNKSRIAKCVRRSSTAAEELNGLNHGLSSPGFPLFKCEFDVSFLTKTKR